MKNLKILFVFVILTLFTANAQTKNSENKDKLKSLKIAYITTELDLTADESAKFWPIFNAFETKQKDIRSLKTKSYLSKLNDDDLAKMSDKDANSLLSQLESTEEELFLNRKKLIASLKTILPPIKILKLKRAEDNFGKKLLQQYRNKD